jgi:hypothetical protein
MTDIGLVKTLLLKNRTLNTFVYSLDKSITFILHFQQKHLF